MQRAQPTRVAAALALFLAVLAVVVLLLGRGSTYVLHARFSDAGQLVQGDLVSVGGHQVGTVGKLSLASDGMADVELDIGDSAVAPVHADTRAYIGQISLTGVANRFVGLEPSAAGPPIPSGGVLPPTQTRGIVDLDILLDSLTPQVRTSLRHILTTGAYLVAQPTASAFNRGLAVLNPALSQTAELGAELVADRIALQRLLSSTAKVSTGLADHSGELGGAVTSTAAVLHELASQRAALTDVLERTPPVLGQGRRVLGHVDAALGVLYPTLRDLQPVAPQLATLLRIVVPAGREAIPTVKGVQALVAPAERALRALPPVERKATPAIVSLTRATRPLTPILAGLRSYGPAVIAGFFGGVGGYSGGYYDANGEYLRVGLEAGAQSFSGLLGLVTQGAGGLDTTGLLSGVRTGLLAACPGGATAPAYDASNPWNNPPVLPGTGNICNPSHNR